METLGILWGGKHVELFRQKLNDGCHYERIIALEVLADLGRIGYKTVMNYIFQSDILSDFASTIGGERYKKT